MEVQSAIEKVVQEIKNQPQERRLDWIEYFLNSLDKEIGPGLLPDIAMALEIRLERGMWPTQ